MSIDINLQQEVERILAEQIRNAKTEANTDYYDHSSVIIQDPKTGEILAMAGKKIVNGDIIDNTTSLLEENSCSNYELFLDSHSNMTKHLSSYLGKVSLVLFNLGYLPNGDKTITTNYESTILAIEDALKLIHKMGMILLVIYPGHENGKLESIKIHEYLDNKK